MQENGVLAKRSEVHLKRRFWHIFCGLICLVGYYQMDFPMYYWAIFSLLIAGLGFYLDFQRLRNEELNEKMAKLFGPIMRKSESISFSGLPFYALGVGISILLYKPDIAILAILFLIFADPFASIVGVHYGKDRLLPNKTLQGTVAAFIMCFVVTLIYMGVVGNSSPNIILFAFFGGILGAFSEMLSAFNIDDNLTIPVVSGAFLSVLDVLFKIF